MIEYELIDIEFHAPYATAEEEEMGAAFMAADSEDESRDAPTKAELDADGIPMGRTKAESLVRRQFIFDYIQKWREEHKADPRVFNEYLRDYIKINQMFMLESVGHAAYSYLSTKAVLRMEEVMTKAKTVGQTKPKEGNSNQKAFQQMIIMRYSADDLGEIKLTVGVRNRTQEKVGYSITVPDPSKPFIDAELQKGKKKKKRSK